MLKLDYSYDLSIESTYIITIKNHSVSEGLSARCQQSLAALNMPYKVWDAFDGTSGQIKLPDHAQGKSWYSWLKWVDKELSITEVSAALSHISLWAHCIEIDRPIIILEHDAIMIKELRDHPVIGCIHYLGAIEQAKKGWPVLVTPPHATNGHNYHFICRAHAYSIDPWVAKNLLSQVLKYGICESLDIMIRSDIFPAVQMGLYAYDEPDLPNTTIVGRKKTIDGKER
jgi:GR25 family glycosyltransferase involved in LPS biosynthesis